MIRRLSPMQIVERLSLSRREVYRLPYLDGKQHAEWPR